MNKEEIIKALKELRDESFDLFVKADWASHEETYHNGCLDAYGSALEIIQGELDEVEKVMIPQFVADEIESHKLNKDPLTSAFENGNLDNWLYGNMARNVDVLARAWLYGYTVEKEPLYLIRFSENQYAVKSYEGGIRSVLVHEEYASKFTGAEIAQLGIEYHGFIILVKEDN